MLRAKGKEGAVLIAQDGTLKSMKDSLLAATGPLGHLSNDKENYLSSLFAQTEENPSDENLITEIASTEQMKDNIRNSFTSLGQTMNLMAYRRRCCFNNSTITFKGLNQNV